MINRIIIAKRGKFNIFGDLKRCKVCKINFSAISPCIMCSLRIKKKKELGRKLTKKELRDLFKFLE
jgi:rRNA-processing protein FCF1